MTNCFRDKARQFVVGLLLVAALGSAVYVFTGGAQRRFEELPLNAPVNGVVPQVVVAYFYGGIHCDTCEKLEGYAAEAVEQHFQDALAEGRLVWRTFDMERAGNETLVNRFGLYTKSVVLVELKEGQPARWENLESIWDLVHDREAYQRYIVDSVDAFLRAGEDE